MPFKIDTGSDISIIPEHFLNSTTQKFFVNVEAAVANGSKMSFSSAINATVVAGSRNFNHTFYIANKYTHRAILGLDFLHKYKAVINLPDCNITTEGNHIIPLFLHDRIKNLKVHALESCSIAPYSHAVILSNAVPDQWIDSLILSYIPRLKQGITLSVTADEDNHLLISMFNNHAKPIQISNSLTLAEIRPLTMADATFSVDSLEAENVKPSETEVQALLKRLKINLNQFSAAQQIRIKQVLTENYEAFSISGEMGVAKIDPIHIDFSSSTNPIRCMPYRQSAKDSEVMHDLITTMMQQKILQPANGQWSSPACLVYRKSKPRIVVDYRLVNRAIAISNKAFLPPVLDLLKKIKPGSYLSCLDLSKAYWQFRIDDESGERLAIATDRGTFKPTRLPLGLVTSPSECCHAMQTVLEGLPASNTLHYVDDVAVFHQSLDDLITLTDSLLSKLKKFGLKANPDKTNLFTDRAVILGHEVDRHGMRLPPEYLQKIKDLPTPTSAKEVQVLLGLLNWCASFFPHMSQYTKPLTSLAHATKKDFTWTSDHELAFRHLKHMVTSSPCLMHYDSDLPLELYTDASDFAVSAMLVHVVKEVRHPVAFWSRCLTKSEINYSIYHKEFLAVYAAVKHFRSLLLGQHFTLYLDNTGVSFLKTLKLSQSAPRIARFVTYLNQFQFEVEAIKSAFNPADTLSRLPCHDSSCEICKLPRKFLPVPFTFTEGNSLPMLPTEHKGTQTDGRWCRKEVLSIEQEFSHETNLAEEQSNDEELALLKDKYLSHSLESLLQHPQSPRLTKILTWIPNLELHANMLMIKLTDSRTHVTKLKPILPRHLYKSITLQTHASTLKHAGALKTIDYIKAKCFAPGLNKVARLIVAQCKQCASQKTYTQNTTPGMKSIPPNYEPGSFIAVDHTGPYPCKQGYSYILTVTCLASKHLVLLPQKSITAVATARALLTYFRYYGMPISILSDNGTAFKNALMTELAKTLNTKQLFSTAGHPQGNAQAERMNSFLKDLLTIATNYEGRSWPDHLMSIQLIYNASVHQSTRFTPNFLFFGRELRLPNSIFEDYTTPEQFNSLEEHALTTATRLRQALIQAQKTQSHSLKIAKTYYDKNTAAINAFQPGQIVFLKTPGKKLELRYPQEFVVLRKLHDTEYEIQNCLNPTDVRKINHCRLKPYLAPLLTRNIDASVQTHIPPSPSQTIAPKETSIIKTSASSRADPDTDSGRTPPVDTGNITHLVPSIQMTAASRGSSGPVYWQRLKPIARETQVCADTVPYASLGNRNGNKGDGVRYPEVEAPGRIDEAPSKGNPPTHEENLKIKRLSHPEVEASGLVHALLENPPTHEENLKSEKLSHPDVEEASGSVHKLIENPPNCHVGSNYEENLKSEKSAHPDVEASGLVPALLENPPTHEENLKIKKSSHPDVEEASGSIHKFIEKPPNYHVCSQNPSHPDPQEIPRPVQLSQEDSPTRSKIPQNLSNPHTKEALCQEDNPVNPLNFPRLTSPTTSTDTFTYSTQLTSTPIKQCPSATHSNSTPKLRQNDSENPQSQHREECTKNPNIHQPPKNRTLTEAAKTPRQLANEKTELIDSHSGKTSYAPAVTHESSSAKSQTTQRETYSKPFTRADARAIRDTLQKIPDMTAVPQEVHRNTTPSHHQSSDVYMHEPATKLLTNISPHETVTNAGTSHYSRECNTQNCILHNTRSTTSKPTQSRHTTLAREEQSSQANSVDLDSSRNNTFDNSAQDNHELTLNSTSMAPQTKGMPATIPYTENTQETLNESWLADESPPASLLNESRYNDTFDTEVTTNTSSRQERTPHSLLDSNPDPQDTLKTADYSTLGDFSPPENVSTNAKPSREAKLTAIAKLTKINSPHHE